MHIHDEKVLILDFGSQYTQLIARRVRELGVYCEIHRPDLPLADIKAFGPKGIILSGGPMSVEAEGAPMPAAGVFDLGVPVLGICYGLQLIAKMLGGRVDRTAHREFGPAVIEVLESKGPLAPFKEGATCEVWMSHGDRVDTLPPGFEPIARTANAPLAATAHRERPIFGLQFHPEVVHTPRGKDMYRAFLFEVCKLSGAWTMKGFAEEAVEAIRKQVGQGKVICALSGGVDSSVAALLIHRAIGDRLTCIFVDNGVLRSGEREQVEQLFEGRFHVPLRTVDARKRFLDRLAGVTDPEKKRKIIGREFIAVFEEAARDIQGADFLAQGTLYPDVIESVSTKGPSATIKSHHNVGGLPEVMKLQLVEPLRELFKDEVRALGRELGLPEAMLMRHPFPGPGLAIRVLGEVTEERLELVRKADLIVQDEVRKAGLYGQVWQAFAVLLPVSSVGVMGDERTYESTAVVRAVTSVDGMTADWARHPARAAGAHLGAHHQRGAGHQPRGLRHLQQAARHHRVGVSASHVHTEVGMRRGVLPTRRRRDSVRWTMLVVLFAAGACSHVPAETPKADRRDDWLLALKSDLERIAASDGFQGQVRVLHAGKTEIDRSFGDTACLPLGTGRKLLDAVAVGLLVEGGKVGWDDRLEQRLPSVAGTSFASLTVANLLTDSAGLAPDPQVALEPKLDPTRTTLGSIGGTARSSSLDESLAERLDAAGKVPLKAAPGTRIDPGDERPWLLVERLVAQVSGEPFDRFAEARLLRPAGMTGTSLTATPACPSAVRGTTTLDDQFQLIDALRAGKLVSPQTRAALWEPRLPLGPGSDVGYGFFIRTHGEQRAVGAGGEGASAYELWLDPAGTDGLVLLGRTPARTARGIRTALGEFYALPPGPLHAGGPRRHPPVR